MTPLFREKVRQHMPVLMRDFSLSAEDAAAIFGNIGHECGGFAQMQELKPVVPGSRGGFGWCQWTGPRRREFEAYCARNKLDPRSDKANYGFLFVELSGGEGRRALPALRAAKGLDAKVEAFERAFLRAGVKHYPSRKKWAADALAAYRGAPVPTPKASKTGAAGGAVVVGTGAAVASQDDGSGWLIGLGAALVVVSLIGFVIWRKRASIGAKLRDLKERL